MKTSARSDFFNNKEERIKKKKHNELKNSGKKILKNFDELMASVPEREVPEWDAL